MVENNNQKATTEDENDDRTIAVYKAIWSIFIKGFHESISEAPTYFFVIRELIVSWVLRKMENVSSRSLLYLSWSFDSKNVFCRWELKG